MSVIIHPQTIIDGFTQSEIGTMDECAYKWYLRYNLLWQKKGGIVWWAIIGNAWHTIMEEMYATKGKRWSVPTLAFEPDATPTQADECKLEFWQDVLTIMADAYAQHYAADFATLQIEADGLEQVADVTIEFEGVKIRLMGKLDLRATMKNRGVLWDHKTTGIDVKIMVAGWDFKFQFMFYLWLARKAYKISSFMVNAMIKPKIRLGKAETLGAFCNRLRLDMTQFPEKYFYRQKLDLTTHSMEHFETETLVPKLRRIAMISNPKTPPSVLEMLVMNKNTNACHNWNSTCEYFQICQHGIKESSFLYERRPAKHTELGEEE